MTTTASPGDTWVSRVPGAALPRRAAGVELFGEYDAGGFVEPKYLLRRPDGQVVQLPFVLYLVACELDGRAGAEAIAQRVSARSGKTVSAADVTFLTEQRLAPLGVLQSRTGASAPMPKGTHLLALGLRAALLPTSVVRAVSRPLQFLFHPVIVVAALVGLVVLDVWLFFIEGVSSQVLDVLTDPALLAALGAFQIASGIFHELGHATACLYGGARPGKIGAGIYLVWPVFYSDVTDSYRLDRRGRLRTDLGGVYFNLILILVLTGAYLMTGFKPLLVAILLEQLDMLQQFLPFLRLDGYYIISDLVGVPDLFSRIGPILRSFRPGARPNPAVTELKPKVRVIVTVWVVLTVVAIATFVVTLVINAPAWVDLASAVFAEHAADAASAAGEGDLFGALVSGVRAGLVFIPALGIALMVGRIVRGRRRRSRRHGAGALAPADLPVAVGAAATPALSATVPGAGGAFGAGSATSDAPKRVALTAEQFATFPLPVRWRGYDRDQVRALLGAVARRYSASSGTGDPSAQADPVDDRATSALAAQLLGEAEEHANRLRQEAEAEAQRKLEVARQIFEEAAAEAEAMRARAGGKAATIIDAAQRQLDLAVEIKMEARRKIDDEGP